MKGVLHRIANASAAERLLILLAKNRLTEEEKAYASRLAGEIDDWDCILDTAGRKHSLPLMRLHLGALGGAALTAAQTALLNAAANETALRNIALINAQKRFVERCLGDIRGDLIFLKGVNLAIEYYDDIGLRPSRDIDILVRPKDFCFAVRSALAAGYRVASSSGFFVDSEDGAFDTLMRLEKSVSIVTPEGFTVDIVCRLDKHSGMFDLADPFRFVKTLEFSGEVLPVLEQSFLFNYVCHHHARHVWSRLHWISDLDAMVRAPSFDRNAVVALAAQFGQRGTVEASLDLCDMLGSEAAWSEPEAWPRGACFLDLCIRNLAGDLELEKRVGVFLIGGEFMFPWQAREDVVARARRSHWLTLFRPTFEEYAQFPLPRWLQGVYVFARVWRVARNLITRIGNARA